MTGKRSERSLSYRVDWLEMRSRPVTAPVPAPSGEDIRLTEAADFPLWFFFALYDAVGRDYVWQDMHQAPHEEVRGFLGDDRTRLFTMMRHGWPQGFFLLDARQPEVSDIAYFGLVGEAIGKGFGGWLLDRAVQIGWESERVRKVTINTCTLDHPRAMPLYEGRGFIRVRSENRRRISMTSSSQAE